MGESSDRATVRAANPHNVTICFASRPNHTIPAMTHLLAQSGGSIPWNSPGFWKAAAILVAVLFSLLGAVMRKVQEKKVKRDAELATLRRRDDILRTGRDETGAYVNLSRPLPAEQPEQNDPRQQLRELAERTRVNPVQLLERVKRVGPGPQRLGRQAPIRNAPPVIATSPPSGGRAMAQMPGAPTLGTRGPTERDVRRQREQQANKKAATAAAAAAKRKSQEPVRQAMPEQQPRRAGSAPDNIAYDIPKDHQAPVITVSQQATASKVGAALARIGGGTTASEWRKAIVLSELLGRPVSLRQPDERVM